MPEKHVFILTLLLLLQTESYLYRTKGFVRIGVAQFYFLSENTVRVSCGQQNDDRPTTALLNKTPNPEVSLSIGWENNHWIILSGLIKISYKEYGCPFTASSLKIVYKDNLEWFPSKTIEYTPAIIESLDGLSGWINLDCRALNSSNVICNSGILSLRDGITEINDSLLPRFTENWIAPSLQLEDHTIFFYGKQLDLFYKEYADVAGHVPLVNNRMFGVMWSKFYGLSSSEYKNIAALFQRYDVPLDVILLDMSWHFDAYEKLLSFEKDHANQFYGWTGYTFNKKYIPCPSCLAQEMSLRNLSLALNIHPAAGVMPYEEKFMDFTEAMNYSYQSKFHELQLTCPKYMSTMWRIFWKPLLNEGYSFFWLDWQQGSTTHIPYLTPTLWLNHLVYQYQKPTGHLHRWGGQGNHRYPFGFSGDYMSSWNSLAFLPYFTSSSALHNFYWSHDLGGHFGDPDEELYIRWLQFGIFSPVVRFHSSQSSISWRLPWEYSASALLIAKQYLKMRIELVPYISSEWTYMHLSGLPFIQPLIINDKVCPFCGFFFGRNIFVHPIVMSATETYIFNITLPLGSWIESHSEKEYKNYALLPYSLDEYPIFIKSGSIIPLKKLEGAIMGQSESLLKKLVVDVYIGSSNHGEYNLLYNCPTGVQGQSMQFTKNDSHIHIEISPSPCVSPRQLVTLNLKSFNGAIASCKISTKSSCLISSSQSVEISLVRGRKTLVTLMWNPIKKPVLDKKCLSYGFKLKRKLDLMFPSIIPTNYQGLLCMLNGNFENYTNYSALLEIEVISHQFPEFEDYRLCLKEVCQIK